MLFNSVLSSLLKGKFLAIALVSIAVATGTVAMAASTPAGRNAVQAIHEMEWTSDIHTC
jgi:hypothetical protein